jgi:hypothetical protein
MKHKIELSKCYCGATPNLDEDSEDTFCYVCPDCGFAPDRYYTTKHRALTGWNSWIKNPRRWRIEKGER